ncbi:MAG: FAD-dependent oxidoreductase [Sutterellaceae bacterium]|nr:FAD-dependent oxidoreductase [Sutterellaceae bacterium]
MSNITTSRRGFLKNSLFGAAGAVASGTILGVPAAQAAVQKWDETTDLVVIGWGAAGLTTAIVAAQNGCNVVILERQPESSARSNTRMSGGMFHTASKDYNHAALKAYAKAMFSGENIPWKEEGEQPEFSDEMAEYWAQYLPKFMDFMQGLDPEFKIRLGRNHADGQKSNTAFPDFPGAKDSGYQAGRATYRARGAGNNSTYGKPKLETEYGEAFWQCLMQGAKKYPQIRVVYDTKAEHLVKNDQGEIIGVVANQKGKRVTYGSKKAVAICSGGYEYNKHMRQAFLEGPGVDGWAFYGTLYNEGDGIRMGMEAGAGLMKVGKCAARMIWPLPIRHNGLRVGTITPVVGRGHSIVVDNFGKRFAAETLITDDPTRYFFYKEAIHFDIKTLQYPRNPSWLIFDDKLRRERPVVNFYNSVVGFDFIDYGNRDNSDAVKKGWILKGDTLEELAEKIRTQKENCNRMDGATLAETVKRFNKFCDDKKDLDFDRRAKTLEPLSEGPFYAVPLVAGGPNTKGGLAADAKRRVLDWDYKPIPRLFAVGEVASVLKFVYQSGGNLTECVVFGQVAGKEIAKLDNVA